MKSYFGIKITFALLQPHQSFASIISAGQDDFSKLDGVPTMLFQSNVGAQNSTTIASFGAVWQARYVSLYST